MRNAQCERVALSKDRSDVLLGLGAATKEGGTLDADVIAELAVWKLEAFGCAVFRNAETMLHM